MLKNLLLCSLYDLNQSPSLILGKRSGLHNLNGIALLALIVLVMSLELVSALYNLAVQRMLNVLYDSNNYGLVHLVTDNLTGTGFS